MILVSRRHSLHRESEESFVHHALEALEGYAGSVLHSIVSSVSLCPQLLRKVLKNIQSRVRERWPEETHEVRHTHVCHLESVSTQSVQLLIFHKYLLLLVSNQIE